MRSCQEVSQLLSESMDRRLSLWEKATLRFHVAMCKLCSGFSDHLGRLRAVARRHAEQIESDSGAVDAALSDEARQRIKRALEGREASGRK